MKELQKHNPDLLIELNKIIQQGKNKVAVAVNSTLTLVFWEVGQKINDFTLDNKRAEYGKEIVKSLSIELVDKYGKSFTSKNLHRMMQFAEQFSDFEIVVTLSRQLSWSHFLVLIPIKNTQKQLFYANKIKEERGKMERQTN
jgi:hypothetical protein